MDIWDFCSMFRFLPFSGQIFPDFVLSLYFRAFQAYFLYFPNFTFKTKPDAYLVWQYLLLLNWVYIIQNIISYINILYYLTVPVWKTQSIKYSCVQFPFWIIILQYTSDFSLLFLKNWVDFKTIWNEKNASLVWQSP